MAEAELASDLLGALVDGIQPKKAISLFYKKYDDDEESLNGQDDRFDEVMSYLGEIYPAEILSHTNFKRIHLFYSLFCAIAHLLYGLKGLDGVVRPVLTPKTIGKARVRLDEISARYDEVTAKEAVPASSEYIEFIDASRRATTDLKTRRLRSTFLCTQLAQVL